MELTLGKKLGEGKQAKVFQATYTQEDQSEVKAVVKIYTHASEQESLSS